MLPLREHQTKVWLRARGLPVPRGGSAASAEAAAALARDMSEGAVVKALVPAGRRGKSGGVHLVADAQAAERAAEAMIGTTVAGHSVSEVYVEERVGIAHELYLSISLVDDQIKILLSQQGGVDIEDTFTNAPEKIVSEDIDVLAGLSRWHATELWSKAGVRGPLLRTLGGLTSDVFEAFRAADAVTLELNPIAVDNEGRISLVGAMMAIDEYALFRQPQWKEAAAADAAAQSLNSREQRVRAANAAIPGGEAQYVELDGDIGLLVGGGGAGLYIHDLVVSMGGKPANHCVTPPTSSDTRKLKEVMRAILDNPRLRGMLIGFNFAQMARADIRIDALAEVLRERGLDRAPMPIVVRLFGPGEEKARKVAAEFGGITYLPRGTSLLEACRIVVDKTGAAA